MTIQEDHYRPGGVWASGELHDAKDGREIFVIHSDVGTAFAWRMNGPNGNYIARAEFAHGGSLHRMQDHQWRTPADFTEIVQRWMRKQVPVA